MEYTHDHEESYQVIHEVVNGNNYGGLMCSRSGVTVTPYYFILLYSDTFNIFFKYVDIFGL